MQRQMHSVAGLLSMLRDAAAEHGMRPEQRLVFDAMARTSALSLTLADDADAEALTMSRVPEVPGGDKVSVDAAEGGEGRIAEKFARLRESLGELKLNTVCADIQCPNSSEVYTQTQLTWQYPSCDITSTKNFCKISA
jgi:hypothetical protein